MIVSTLDPGKQMCRWSAQCTRHIAHFTRPASAQGGAKNTCGFNSHENREKPFMSAAGWWMHGGHRGAIPYRGIPWWAAEVPWGGHWYTASVGPGLDYSQQASSLLYQNYVLEIAMSLLQRLSSCFSSWKRGAWQNVLFLISISSQDSCTEANTPDHTVEASTVQVDEVTSNEANNSSDSLLSNLFEKLFRLNQKLEVQEDDIFRLTLQVFKPHLCWLSFNCIILMSSLSKCKTLA